MIEARSSWHSYPSIYNLGHKAVAELTKHRVLVEEKVDGSQFSFGLFGDELRMKSKGAIVYAESAGMFQLAVDSVARLRDQLVHGWTYRAEYLMKPKHNTLKYHRAPAGNLILFDINTGEEEYADQLVKLCEATRLGLECVPLLFEGMVSSPEQLKSLMELESILGDTKIEGVVLKPARYNVYGVDKKVLMGKHVSEAFKESHAEGWKKANPSKLDVVSAIIAANRTEARWRKAVQHLRDAGRLDDSPRDIGPLIAEVRADIVKECSEEIREALYKHSIGHIQRGVAAGVAEWYKNELMGKQFKPGEL
jgi:hypothetical protein